MVDVLIGQDYVAMGRVGVENIYKLIKGETIDLGVATETATNYIDTGYEVVDADNYAEVWANKAPW